MELNSLSDFIEARAELLPTKFQLGGNLVSSKDLADKALLMPLVVAEAAEIFSKITDGQGSFATFKASDQSTQLLSCSIESLGNIPEGLIHLVTNHAMLNLCRTPDLKLDLPRNLSEEALPPTSDLNAHILKHAQLLKSPLLQSNNNAHTPTM